MKHQFFCAIAAVTLAFSTSAAYANDNYVALKPLGNYHRADVIDVVYCTPSKCNLANTGEKFPSSSLKLVRGSPGAKFSKKWGWLPSYIVRAASKNCKSNKNYEDCLCEDGAQIGACGD